MILHSVHANGHKAARNLVVASILPSDLLRHSGSGVASSSAFAYAHCRLPEPWRWWTGFDDEFFGLVQLGDENFYPKTSVNLSRGKGVFGQRMAMQLAAGGGGQSSRMRCLYIFNRNGVCVHYHVWHRPLSNLNRQEDQKLMFGLLYSLKSFTSKMDPLGGSKAQQAGLPASQGQGCSFHSYKTNTYKLSFMETATGIKFVLLTDPNMGDLREALRSIYSNIYVEFVVKNPLYTPNTPFKCELFNTALDHYVNTLK